eukprot:TRINITY_DN65988_c0_g1_i1.p1 TRINITY_DN65988_c0_g1~~TRINITY_DN65988_c0_g1_i1.p1  ORF type:complete len:696 (+),score=210.42 TRINITY_DN65988_c0_g1_i1:59-2146(+)
MSALDDEERQGRSRIVSLPQLQNIMKKDPEAYVGEFDQQWSHFQSMLDIFKLKPQKPSTNFSEQVMFLAHVASSFPERAASLPGILMEVLREHAEVMHPTMRQTLVGALILLRNRDQFRCIQGLPLYFQLFRLNDKSLRSSLFSHIVRDIVQMSTGSKNQKVTTELVDFFFARLKESDVEVARRACAVFISLNRQNIWNDARAVNLMSAGLLHPDLKIAAALAHLFLGNKTKGLEGILEESDDENEEEEAADLAKCVVGAKKTANREKRVKRAKKAAKKALEKKSKKQGQESVVSFVAIDLLHDPQALAEKLHQRVSKGGEPYQFRLLLLHLVARIVGRNQLQLLNLYPFLVKYLQPTQKDVTMVLAALAEATHAQVPPVELRPVVLHIMKTFVTETQAPEVIQVGLNSIREVCVRAVNVLEEEELADLCGFRKFKHKGVAMAARGLINAYRELHPQLLHRLLRGRQAATAVARGELSAPVYGEVKVDEIEGLDLLMKKKKKRAAREAAEDSDFDGEESEEEDKENDVVDASSLVTEQVLSSEDFQKLRKLKLQKSIEMQLGRKRRAEEMSGSSSDSDSDDAGNDSDEERGLTGRLPSAVSADQLMGMKKKARNKAARVEGAKSGFDFKERINEKRASRKGGKTNAEHARNKPQKMVAHNSKAQNKRNRGAKEKVKNLKNHIKTLKTKCKQKRRR